MMRRTILAVLLTAAAAWPQDKLTLDQAVATALKNNPRLSAEHINSLAAEQAIAAARAALYPTIVASTTAAGATADSRLAAGALNNPIIFNRYAAGASIGQLITDFGRTAYLVETTRARAGALREGVRATRAQLALAVHRAYYSVLRASGVLKAAEEAERARALSVEQVTALAKSNLKSTLDASFAQVNHSEAKLAVLAARNERIQAMAELSAVMGHAEAREFDLADVPPLTEAPPRPEDLIAEALRNRPEIAALRLERAAAVNAARAESRLTMPTVTALASMGVAPVHDDRLKNRYAAAAINFSMPVFNGGLFSARRREAELRVNVVEQRLRDAENQIAQAITAAVANARTGFERIHLTDELLSHAKLAAELARERYGLGLSSIVELSQAELNQTAAEIRAAAAQYDYRAQRAVVDFQAGRLDR